MDIATIFKKSARINTLIMSCGMIIAATGCALLRGEMEILLVVLCLLFACFSQLAGNYLHRYYDVVHNYGESIDENMVPTGDADANSLRKIASTAFQCCLILASTIGLAILAIAGWWTIIPAILVYGLLYYTYAATYPIYRTPFAAVPPFLFFGPIGIISAVFVQIFHDNPEPFSWYYMSPCIFVSFAMGCLAAVVQLVHGLNFIDRDSENNKISFAVKFGKNATITLIFVLGLAYFAIMETFVLTQNVRHIWEASLFAFIPAVFNTLTAIGLKRQKGVDHLDEYGHRAEWTYFIAGLLICIFACVFGDADTSKVMWFRSII